MPQEGKALLRSDRPRLGRQSLPHLILAAIAVIDLAARRTYSLEAGISGGFVCEPSERLIASWTSRRLLSTEGIEGLQRKHHGRNGGGDPYYTDGNLLLGVLKNDDR